MEVDVVNGRTPEQPVAGVTVVAGEAEATTGEAGCAILGGIPATKITVEAFKVGDVTEAGAVKNISPELAIAPNVTTHKEVVLNTGSYITAEFIHEGKKAKGDTIVAYNPKMNLAPDFEVGSTRFGAFTKETGEYEARSSQQRHTKKLRRPRTARNTTPPAISSPSKKAHGRYTQATAPLTTQPKSIRAKSAKARSQSPLNLAKTPRSKFRPRK